MEVLGALAIDGRCLIDLSVVRSAGYGCKIIWAASCLHAISLKIHAGFCCYDNNYPSFTLGSEVNCIRQFERKLAQIIYNNQPLNICEGPAAIRACMKFP